MLYVTYFISKVLYDKIRKCFRLGKMLKKLAFKIFIIPWTIKNDFKILKKCKLPKINFLKIFKTSISIWWDLKIELTS